MSLKQRRNFGWLPDLPDHRDLLLHGRPPRDNEGPTRIDLTGLHQFNVYDQGYLGSCVSHAVASAIEFSHSQRPNDPDVPDFLEEDRKFPVSRLFMYYEARKAFGMETVDSGAYVRDVMRVAYNIGAPRESGWKYSEEKFADKPPRRSYKYAPYHKISSYKSVAVNVAEVRGALMQELPVVIGVCVFDSFYDNPDGDIELPRSRDEFYGGHAVLLVGYDDSTRRFKFLNSWGQSWGRAGYGTLPYSYVSDPGLGDDYWVLTDELYKERMEQA